MSRARLAITGLLLGAVAYLAVRTQKEGSLEAALSATATDLGDVVSGIDASLKNLIAKFEGLRLDVYQDAAGYWTVGYGHLVKEGEPYHPYGPVTEITQDEADRLLAQDSAEAQSAVERLVHVPLSAEQKSALVSFVFNVGVGNFERSTLLKKLNANDYVGAADEFPKWNMARGQVLPGLVRRRYDEREVFLA